MENKMANEPQSKSPGVRAHPDRAAHAVPTFTVLNYDFSGDPPGGRAA
jgi:hypothetical protein